MAESLALAWENESDMGEVLESLLAVLGESLELEGRPGLLDDVGKCWKNLENDGSIANLRHFVCSVEVMCPEGQQDRHTYYAKSFLRQVGRSVSRVLCQAAETQQHAPQLWPARAVSPSKMYLAVSLEDLFNFFLSHHIRRNIQVIQVIQVLQVISSFDTSP